MSKEELHACAIGEIERTAEKLQHEPEGGFRYYLKGELTGLVNAYYHAGAISIVERNKYKA